MANVVVVPRGDRTLFGGPQIIVLADHRGKCHLVNMETGEVYWCCEATKTKVYHSEKHVDDYVDAKVQDDGTVRLLRFQPDQKPQIIFLSSSQDEISQCLKDIYGNIVIVTKNHQDFNVDYNAGSLTTPHASSSNIFKIRRFDYECSLLSNVSPIIRWVVRFSTFQCFFPSGCECYVYHVHGETQFFDICKYLKIENFADGKTLAEVICEGVIEPKKISVCEDFIALQSDKSIFMGGYYEKTTPIMIRKIARNSIDIDQTLKNITSANTHTNLVRYYATEVDGDYYNLAFERCTTSLKDKLLNISDISSKSWELKFTRGIVMAIMYLHSNDVVHGELCPANVLVDNNDVVKLLLIASLMTNTEDIKEGKMNNVYVVGKLLLYYMTRCSFKFESDNPLEFLYMLPDDAREAKDLIIKILNREIVDIGDVYRHCYFRYPETRLSFTREVRDRLLAFTL